MKKHELPQLNEGIHLIDTHCHLDMETYRDDFTDVLNIAATNGVEKIISIGIDLKSSRAAIELAKSYPNIKATVGVHPHDVENIDQETYKKLKHLVLENREWVVGYGEIGLDYAKMYAPKDIQKQHFQKQLLLAQELDLPIIIHCRDAQKDIIEIVKETCTLPVRGVIHCFSGDLHFAEEAMNLGFYLSIPGVVTFKNAHDIQEVAAVAPLEKLLVETDGPFLAPMPYRGKRNLPTYVLYTAQKIAELRGTDINHIATATTKNAIELFSL